VLSLGVGLTIAGYLVAVLFPLTSVLEPWHHLSPWDWAPGGDPLANGPDLWRFVALGLPSVALTILGALAVDRRDVAAP